MEENRKERAVRLFREGYNCSQSVFVAYSDLYGLDKETACRLSASFGAGMGRMREVCGAASGMFLIAGLATGATEGKDAAGKQHNYETVQKLAAEFKKRSGGSLVCRELLGLTKRTEGSGGGKAKQDEKTVEYYGVAPEKRTEEYYKKRPCVKLVEMAAEIIEEMLLEPGATGKDGCEKM